MGIFSDRIGRKKAMLIGIGIFTVASTIELLVTDKYILLSMAFFSGVGGTLYFLNVAPFLMKISKPETRTFIFSVNFALVILAGVVGNLCASQFSSLYAGILQVLPGSATAYRATLITAVSLSYLELVLLMLIKDNDFENVADGWIRPGKSRQLNTMFSSVKEILAQPVVLKLAAVQVVFGFGVAILSPYINLFFHETYQVSDQTLGVIFSLKALFTGLGAMLIPRMVKVFNCRIKLVVFSYFIGALLLLVLGFPPVLPLAVFAFLGVGVFLNAPIPLMNAFSMEQVGEDKRATLGSIRELSWQISWGIGPYVSGVLQVRGGFSPVFLLSFGAVCLSAAMTKFFFVKKEQEVSVISQEKLL
jgi:MFS family permease